MKFYEKRKNFEFNKKRIFSLLFEIFSIFRIFCICVANIYIYLYRYIFSLKNRVFSLSFIQIKTFGFSKFFESLKNSFFQQMKFVFYTWNIWEYRIWISFVALWFTNFLFLFLFTNTYFFKVLNFSIYLKYSRVSIFLKYWIFSIFLKYSKIWNKKSGNWNK